MGLTRVALLTGNEIPSKEHMEPFISDIHNITVMINNGQFHLFESERVLSWNLLPVNSIRMIGKHETDCFMGTYTLLKNDSLWSELSTQPNVILNRF